MLATKSLFASQGDMDPLEQSGFKDFPAPLTMEIISYLDIKDIYFLAHSSKKLIQNVWKQDPNSFLKNFLGHFNPNSYAGQSYIFRSPRVFPFEERSSETKRLLKKMPLENIQNFFASIRAEQRIGFVLDHFSNRMSIRLQNHEDFLLTDYVPDSLEKIQAIRQNQQAFEQIISSYQDDNPVDVDSKIFTLSVLSLDPEVSSTTRSKALRNLQELREVFEENDPWIKVDQQEKCVMYPISIWNHIGLASDTRTIIRLHAAQGLKMFSRRDSSREILLSLSLDAETEPHIKCQVAQELTSFDMETREEAISIFRSIGLDHAAPISLRMKILNEHLSIHQRSANGTVMKSYRKEALDIFENIGLDQQVSSNTRDWCAQEILNLEKRDLAAQIWHSIGLSPKSDGYVRTHPAKRLKDLGYEKEAGEIWHFIGLDTSDLEDKKYCVKGLYSLGAEYQSKALEIIASVPADQKPAFIKSLQI